MANKKEYPVRFAAKGLSDAYDSTETFAGACVSLQNLVFDPSNPELVICRPGVGSPIATVRESGFISCHITIGSYVYGMVTSTDIDGYDEPFCWDIGTGEVVITGATDSNTPVSVASTGAWIPPTMAVIGVKIIVTHPGFTGGSLMFGIIDITNPAAPTWTAGNTATNALPSVPRAVVNYNNRAWYACGNKVWYSDSLVPTTMTNAGQSLTIGDTNIVKALCGLPIQTSTAGIISALTVFKEFQIWQITGDAAISGSLALNFISLTVGTNSPRSIVQTPTGIIFIGLDGVYSLMSTGAVTPLVRESGTLEQDIQNAFQNMLYPSRAAAAFSGSIYRVCIVNQDGDSKDYWFDITRRRWNGPHTFAYDCASQFSNYFIISGEASGANLYRSIYVSGSAVQTIYDDDGDDIPILYQSSQFPKTPNINEKQVIESTLEVSGQNNIQLLVEALASDDTVMDAQFISSGSPDASIWGAFIWGQGTWGSSKNAPETVSIPWSVPLIFKKMSIRISGKSNNYISIGSFFAKYRDTGYTNK